LKNTRLLISGLILAAAGTGLTACSPNAPVAGAGHPSGTGSANSGTGAGNSLTSGAVTSMASLGGAGVSTAPGAYTLQSMPVGTVSVQLTAQGHVQAHIVMFGLTPGSAHDVLITGPGRFRPVVRFPALTADGTGQADATLTSAGTVRRLQPLSRFVIREGTATDGSALAAETIAESGIRLVTGGTVALHAVTADPEGFNQDQPAGRATLTFNAAAQTLTVTVTASGLNPGPHAAHIHLGSCQSQGGVKYMLADFVANRFGQVINQTRVVTGVTSVPGPGNWYLNLHQGGMSQILANGMPTLYFRPLLCANLTTYATTGTPVPSATPTTSPSSSPAMTTMPGMPTGTPSATATATGSPSSAPTGSPTPTTTRTPSGTPSPTPTGQPTHW